MKRDLLETERRRVRDGRTALAVLLGLSLLANAALGVGLASVERTTVLVPAVAGPVWEVGGGIAGMRYLEDMGRTVAVTLLTLTPENAGIAREAVARMSHPSARGAIGAWVAAEAARMKGRDLSTAFYPGRVEADPAGLAVLVSGELATWIGRERVSRERKRYRLTFRLDAGRIGLLRFEEMEDMK